MGALTDGNLQHDTAPQSRSGKERAPVMGPRESMDVLPRVCAIVLIYGGEEITAECIDSLYASDYPALDVLLVDNASPDGAGKRLRARYPSMWYLDTGANLGYAAGNNRGMAFALGRGADYVLVINNDTVVERTCVRRLVETAGAGGAPGSPLGLVVPKMLFHELPDRIWFGGGDLSMVTIMGHHRRMMQLDDPAEASRAEPISFATGCCMLLPAGIAAGIGRFDERFFMYGEDVELSIRLGRAGYRMLYQPAARLYHKHAPGPPRPTPFQIRLRDQHRRLIAREHLGWWEKARFYAVFLPSRVVRLVQYAVRRQWAHAAAIVEGAVR